VTARLSRFAQPAPPRAAAPDSASTFEELALRSARDGNATSSEDSARRRAATALRRAHRAHQGASRLAAHGERLLPERPVIGGRHRGRAGRRALRQAGQRDAARAMLARLSGRRHDVITAVALRWHDDVDVALSVSHVTFRRLTAGEIEHYSRDRRTVRQGRRLCDPGTCRGLHHAPRRSYSGVVGTPLAETASLLARSGRAVL
jgi:septum formation protein